MSKKKAKQAEKQEEKEKKKEQKIIYIDDGSTVADMSGTFKRKPGPDPRRQSTFREKMQTFFGTMKKMVWPLLITLTVLTLLYVILLAATGNLW